MRPVWVGNTPRATPTSDLPACCTPILQGPQPGGPEKCFLPLGAPLFALTVPKTFIWLHQELEGGEHGSPG